MILLNLSLFAYHKIYIDKNYVILFYPSLHVYKSKENLFWADETTSDNRDSSSTFIGKLFNFNKTGQKTTDHMMSYKLFKVFGYEVSGWNLIIIISISIC